MFRRKGSPVPRKFARSAAFANLIEALEERQFLSATIAHAALHAAKIHHAAKHVTHASKKHSHASASTSSATDVTSTSTTTNTSDAGSEDPGRLVRSIAFDLTPAAVQNGLDTLASNDGLSAPATTQIVQLGNSNGVETYSIQYTTTGTQTRITVDQNGNAVTAPTLGSVTWADLTGTGANANAAAAGEITTIATALNLTAPTDTTVIQTSTTAGGTIYSVRLSSSSSTDNWGGQNIVVDSNGNPVGNQTVPFSVLPTAIQGYINANLPTGATTLAATATQSVDIRTVDGLVLYSTTFDVSGTRSTVTVDLAGMLETFTAPTTTTFSAIPTAAQTELQTLATAEGVTATIATSQSVDVYTELNGTTIYSVTLAATDSTTSQTFNITIASDAQGDPTVPQGRGGFGGFGSFGSPGFGGPGGGDCGGQGDGNASGAPAASASNFPIFQNGPGF